MRKFLILCLMAFVMCSCSALFYTPTYTPPNLVSHTTKVMHTKSYGDIVVIENADTIYACNNAVLEHKITTTTYNTADDGGIYNFSTSTSDSFNGGLKLGGGVNFIDAKGNCNFVNGGIVFIKNIKEKSESPLVETISLITPTEQEKNKEQDKIANLEKQHQNAREQIEVNKKSMKSLDKNSEEYKIKKEQNEALKGRMKELEKEYVNLTGQYMYSYADNIYK